MLKYRCSVCSQSFETSQKLASHVVCIHKPHRLLSKVIQQSNIEKYLQNPFYCKNCNQLISYSQYKQAKHFPSFCSHSCSASFSNKHKTKGTRISKVEKYLQNSLLSLYPTTIFLFNNKQTIGSELDIYLPQYSLAFELNGIFHYEPIFGKEKLSSIQSNDNNKFKECQINNISLCIIDVSSQRHFTKESSLKYLSIIKSIIDSRLR